jgi:hypothetical protein
MFIVAQFVGALAGLGVMRWFFAGLDGAEPQAAVERS